MTGSGSDESRSPVPPRAVWPSPYHSCSHTVRDGVDRRSLTTEVEVRLRGACFESDWCGYTLVCPCVCDVVPSLMIARDRPPGRPTVRRGPRRTQESTMQTGRGQQVLG